MIDQLLLDTLKDVAFSIALLIVVYLIGRQFLSIWKGQIKSANDFQEHLLKQFSLLDSANDELKDGHLKMVQQLAEMQAGMEASTGRMLHFVQQIDRVVQRWEDANTETQQAVNGFHTDQDALLKSFREEVKSKMNKLEEGNHNLNAQLVELTTQLTNLTTALNATNINRVIAMLDDYAELPGRISALLNEIQAAVERVNQDTEPPSSETKGEDKTA